LTIVILWNFAIFDLSVQIFSFFFLNQVIPLPLAVIFLL